MSNKGRHSYKDTREKFNGDVLILHRIVDPWNVVVNRDV